MLQVTLQGNVTFSRIKSNDPALYYRTIVGYVPHLILEVSPSLNQLSFDCNKSSQQDIKKLLPACLSMFDQMQREWHIHITKRGGCLAIWVVDSALKDVITSYSQSLIYTSRILRKAIWKHRLNYMCGPSSPSCVSSIYMMIPCLKFYLR
ncbi:uncharacterized protein PHALS_14582 [Plasmopara halstedii]|uniref:Uncharacterized protein n=1 Tax=Plasmopara halstedii TaxID=4781 RepID=A0A0P1ALI4_PLAHL|nr:uncharacterized protein PHALS_14582 [Plasmopara halstedii]CEG41949.1 hypothetical protein PHALS_14582 [Plasmopara halstedii]|eukprot:XP_024578318.1 hypothetical protein PHALS_14582 [Plasmopara halstedii]